jgi:tRNA1(Val) A37 N6-methylase TrmN6
MRFVHGTAAAPARIVLVEAQAGRAGGLFVLPPLVEREACAYTPEMVSLISSE